MAEQPKLAQQESPALPPPEPSPPPPEKPLGVTVLVEDLHAVFVMARISMQPRPQPLKPSWTYREAFKRIRTALQQCGRIPT